MRNGVGRLTLVAVLGLALPAGAQQPGASSFFTGANPRNITFTPIDVSGASRTYNMNNVFHTPSPAKSISLTNFLSKFSIPSWPPKVASVQVLQGTNPFQPVRPVGVNLFNPKP
jgi:hypothetical protein